MSLVGLSEQQCAYVHVLLEGDAELAGLLAILEALLLFLSEGHYADVQPFVQMANGKVTHNQPQ